MTRETDLQEPAAIAPRLVEKPWGGNWLAQAYKSDKMKIGEAWLLSTLAEGESTLNGQPLSQALGGPLPFVVKIIDAQENLSVQVHPNDEWARQLENSKGKTECWLILDAKPGAGVYLGLTIEASPRKFEASLKLGSAVETHLQFFPVERGDFIKVPAGTVHAIGGGVTLLEVQQASGITYRLWDWGRAGRELHLDKGLRVASYEKRFEVRKNVLDEPGLLFKHDDFECELNQSHGDGWFIDLETYAVYRGSKAHSRNYLFVR